MKPVAPPTSRTLLAVSTAADSADEGDETFTLPLSNTSGAEIADAAAAGTIRDAAAPSADALTVSFPAAGSRRRSTRVWATARR